MRITIPLRVGIRGEFKFKRFTADGTVRQETGWMRNLVVDEGLDWIAVFPFSSPQGSVNGCVVGSGNTPPTGADTLLESYVAGTTGVPDASVSSSSGTLPYFMRGTVTYRFGEGVAAGNLSEVGIAAGTAAAGADWAGASDAPLFSRALIVDGGGSPTTITVLSDEFLDVSYRLTYYPMQVDTTGSFNMMIEGVSTPFDYVVRAAFITTLGVWNPIRNVLGNSPNIQTVLATADNVNMNAGHSGATNGSLGAVTSLPSGTQSTADSCSSAAYTPGNFYRDLTYNFSLSKGNLSGGITALLFNFQLGAVQMSLDPPVNKTSTKLFEVTIRVSWENVP